MHGGKLASKSEKYRMSRITEIGCLACMLRGVFTGLTGEVHHLTDCGRRRGHMFTICLCSWHHRGVALDGMSLTDMSNQYGPALSMGTRPFRESFGSDDCLLAMQNEMVEGTR